MPNAPTQSPVTDKDLAQVRHLIESALIYFADNAHPTELAVAGVTASELAENVQGWTHTTRLRDFVEGLRK